MKEKDNRIDLLRLISMFLVIIVHVSNFYCRRFPEMNEFSYFGSTLYNTISRICVPIFFMISGALLIGKKTDMKKYRQRIIKFIIVLVIWTLIYFIFDLLYFNPGKTNIVTLVNSLFGPIRPHLWLMYAIIGLYIVLPFISRMVKNMTKSEENLFLNLWLYLMGALYIVRMFLGFNGFITKTVYPIPLIQNAYYLGYFVVGYILYNRVKNTDLKKYNFTLVFTTALSLLITLSGTYFTSLKQGTYFEGFFAYCSFFLMLASCSIYLLVLINYDKSKLDKYFGIIAPYSFGIYLVHIIYLNVFMKKVPMLGMNAFIGVPLFSIIIFILSLITIYLLKKMPYVKKYIC